VKNWKSFLIDFKLNEISFKKGKLYLI